MPPSDDAPALETPGSASVRREDIAAAFRGVRHRSLVLAAPLSPEDQLAQSMPDASPTKWHLAHSTWFFETFVLTPHLANYAPYDPAFGYLFNSYYETVGDRHPRTARGLLTRPSAREVLNYRDHVDRAMARLLSTTPEGGVRELIALGLAHEEQHQELILMDILHLFSASPLSPAYSAAGPAPRAAEGVGEVGFPGGLAAIGARDAGFSFDNETPRHDTLLRPFRLARRLVTNGEWLAFMADGGYRRPEFWLADGWARVRQENWTAPLYWRAEGQGWRVLTLAGLAPLDESSPVAHVSFFEADAFAAWSGKRLPTEAEWEHAAETRPGAFDQLSDQLWQWTASAYSPYPGFRAAAGAVGEYNGKFMVGQMVLKGGAVVTPPGHTRTSYRNFYYPHQRWMFSGVRLASDDVEPAGEDDFLASVIAGLSAPRKRLSSKWFYDARGSALFEAICETAEYYPTRQETALLAQVAPELAARIPAGSNLIELGSGASLKTRLLLDAAPQIACYTPVDISASALEAAAGAIARDYPGLEVSPCKGDFTKIDLTRLNTGSAKRVVFFPGSTIGNFAPAGAVDLMRRLAKMCGPDGLLVIGVDRVKDEATLVAAYDDAGGVTAAFNTNLLLRINSELGGDFDVDAFTHRVAWNRLEGRMEAHLEALRPVTASVGGRLFRFHTGETIHTENSYKYTLEGFEALARHGGLRCVRHWSSPEPTFSIFLLEPSDTPPE